MRKYTNKKRIFRIEHEKNFTQIDNEIFVSDLCLEAKAVLCYMLSKPDNWEFEREQMAKELQTTVYKVKKATNELQEKGYLHIKKVKLNLSWKTEYLVYEHPCLNKNFKTK